VRPFNPRIAVAGLVRLKHACEAAGSRLNRVVKAFSTAICKIFNGNIFACLATVAITGLLIRDTLVETDLTRIIED
jgi:hypothetical protein